MINEIKTSSQKRRINRRMKAITMTREILMDKGEEGLALAELASLLDTPSSRLGSYLSHHCKTNTDINKIVVKKAGRWISAYAWNTEEITDGNDRVSYSYDHNGNTGEEI